MELSRDTASTSRAWVQALRAAALLLNSEVCRQVRARRADLPEAQRDQLDEMSQQAWREAFGLYPQEVWERFEIDEPELRRRAVDLARLRIEGRLAEAAEAWREALRRALRAA
jgi:hypothetical protein